jgi:predicted RecA/RadA family phage recombinase
MSFIAKSVSEGIRIPFTASGADVVSGTPVVFGNTVGVPTHDFADGDDGSLAVEGLFEVAKEATALVTVAGETLLYYDVVDGEVNDDSVNNKLMGVAMQNTIATDTTVLVKLLQVTA